MLVVCRSDTPSIVTPLLMLRVDTKSPLSIESCSNWVTSFTVISLMLLTV